MSALKVTEAHNDKNATKFKLVAVKTGPVCLYYCQCYKNFANSLLKNNLKEILCLISCVVSKNIYKVEIGTTITC